MFCILLFVVFGSYFDFYHPSPSSSPSPKSSVAISSELYFLLPTKTLSPESGNKREKKNITAGKHIVSISHPIGSSQNASRAPFLPRPLSFASPLPSSFLPPPPPSFLPSLSSLSLPPYLVFLSPYLLSLSPPPRTLSPTTLSLPLIHFHYAIHPPFFTPFRPLPLPAPAARGPTLYHPRARPPHLRNMMMSQS